MPAIQILSEQVANQIAAGEVVEQPASVVKELVENAIDAGATAITIEVQYGGRFLRITDNGHGIAPESFPLAFKRFATSKLVDFSDIWGLRTMGFRGEALPSIASVAKIEAVSRPVDGDTGRRLLLHGGELVEESPWSGAPGTSLTVSELFYNTPARLKFLHSENTELGYIQQLVQTFALGHPAISFKFIKNGKEALYTTGNTHLQGVVRQLFGKETSEALFTVKHQNEGGQLEGVLSYPDFVRRDRNRQFIFVNRRWVKVPAISKLLDDVYADLVPKKYYPVVVLYLEVPPETVDVNVHPTKKEVKFKHYNQIYHLLKDAIQKSLHGYQAPAAYIPPTPIYRQPETEEAPPFADEELIQVREPAPLVYQPRSQKIVPPVTGLQTQVIWPTAPDKPAGQTQDPLLQSIVPIAQTCRNTYIVAHYGEGLALIDQHIAQERYLYEKFLAELKVPSQTLVMSLMLELDDVALGLLAENHALFEQMGFDFERFGHNAIAIRAIPQCMQLGQAEDTIPDLLNELRESGVARDKSAAFNRLCKTLSCRSSIMAGDPLSMEQMQELIRNWLGTQNPYTCPHGRPIVIKFTKHELDRRFMRV